MAISANDFFLENAGGSDSDSNSDDSPDYYQPISAVEDENEDSDQGLSIENDGDHVPDSSDFNSFSSENPNFHRFSNGFVHGAENGISSLDLNDDDLENSEGEAEERTREASDTAFSRAVRDDESRRNAPLAPENASRIMEAMRGVSFGGFAPDWVDRLPEDRWVDQLRRLRQAPTSTTTRN
ncbi:hypothetical protein HHK36_010660 [Tetracentron sinense]|uniref:Uncharacterized protein n=1 Tax=Tetracentron sinense TaxID=13715 RepID=A0A835DJR8_TETSI|nr:hypothetical protein HHK36_010660 [Tetracentron sinense]